MTSPELDSLTMSIDRRVPLSITIRESTLSRLEQLVAKVQHKNPGKKRSQIIDSILSETLDRLQIQS